MYSLNEQQLSNLQKPLKLANTAELELDEAFSTGRMSDAKSAVFAVKTTVEMLDVPEELAAQLQQVAQESWHGATGAGGDVYERAGKAIAGIGRIQTLLGQVMEVKG